MSNINIDDGRVYINEQYAKLQGGIGAPPIDRDPDSVEALLQQVMSQAFDIKEALQNTRSDLLGPWPEPADHKLSGSTSGPGLIPKTKEILHRMLDVQREIREHVVAISKGVR